MSRFPKIPRGWTAVFAAALFIHFCCSMVGWNYSLLEHQSYRQSQTAMAVEYMMQDNAWINYMTPVLGPPWQVPMEFPLYQMIVAVLCLVLHSPIDQTGRAVSLLFFYAALWPMNLFLKHLVPEKNLRLMMLSLVLAAPLYIYFSRAVLIESTALFLGFSFLALTAEQYLRPSVRGIVAMIFCGSLCALVKITTFCAFCFPCLIVPLVGLGGPISLQRKLLLRSAIFLPAFVLPFLVGVWWTHRSDLIKMASPATRDLTSTGLSSWNFGTLAQRLDLSSWSDLLARISFGLTFWPILAAIFVLMFWIKRDDRRLIGLFLLSAFVPVLVFFNLHVVHDYYFYASSIFLIFAIGYIFACLMRSGKKWGNLFWAGTMAAFFAMYGFFILQSNNDDQEKIIRGVAKVIRENSETQSSLLIYGEVWDSRIPYQAQRKAFMNYYFDQVEVEDLDKRLEKLKGWEDVRLAIVNTDALHLQPYLEKRLETLGFSKKPDFIVGGFYIYRKISTVGK